MRSFIAFLITATPALAHPGHGVHLHEANGLWIAAAFAMGAALTLAVLRRPAKVDA